MSDKKPFKIAFPSVTLPERYGGKRAAVIFGASRRDDMNTIFATCIDEDGRAHFNVAFTRTELMGSKPMVLVEDPNAKAPVAGTGTGLVGPQGQPL